MLILSEPVVSLIILIKYEHYMHVQRIHHWVLAASLFQHATGSAWVSSHTVKTLAAQVQANCMHALAKKPVL